MLVRGPSTPRLQLVDKPDGPTVRQQTQAHARACAAADKAALEAAPPEKRGALKKQQLAAAQERGRLYAAMITSEPGWKPKEGSKAEGQVLTAFYRRIGQRGRELAAKEGKPFSIDTLKKVRLTKDDVEALRKEFGDDEVKKAMPLLERHIIRESFLDRAAMKFMKSTEFLTFRMALQQSVDKMDRDLAKHRKQLDERSAENLREHQRALKKRKQVNWNQEVVVHKTTRIDGTKQKQTYASVGGRLVPIDQKRE
jgi:hypothetical protein